MRALPMSLAVVVLCSGCLKEVALYCDEDKPCSDPERPFCDLAGEYAASEGIGNICIPDPFGADDAGPDGDAADGDAGTDGGLDDGPERIVEVAPGFAATCARTSRGRVRCWGAQSLLGYDASENIGDDEYPTAGQDVPLPEPAIKIATKGSHACAITESRRLICWGSNTSGELGIPPEQGKNTPPVEYANVGAEVVDVSIENSMTCVELASGSARCFGKNASGQLGVGSTEAYGDDEPASDAPLVALPGPVEMIHAAEQYACAVLEDKNVYCWGRNRDGVLGLELSVEDFVGDDETPASAGNLRLGLAAKSIALGTYSACVLGTNGQVRCWGQNSDGRLGRGLGLNDQTANPIVGDDDLEMPPTVVDLPGPAVAIGVTTAGACALLDDQTLHCWGAPTLAGRGDGVTIGDDEPVTEGVAVDVGAPVKSYWPGIMSNCVITTEDKVRCWGGGYGGILGHANEETIGDDEVPATWGDIQIFPDL